MNLWQMPEQELIIHPTLEHANLNSWAICNGKERGTLELFTSQVARMKEGEDMTPLALPQSGGCAKSNLSAFDCYHICIFHSWHLGFFLPVKLLSKGRGECDWIFTLNFCLWVTDLSKLLNIPCVYMWLCTRICLISRSKGRTREAFQRAIQSFSTSCIIGASIFPRISIIWLMLTITDELHSCLKIDIYISILSVHLDLQKYRSEYSADNNWFCS